MKKWKKQFHQRIPNMIFGCVGIITSLTDGMIRKRVKSEADRKKNSLLPVASSLSGLKMASEIRTTFDLMQALAKKLGGEDVILRMHGCAYEKYDGISYKSDTGGIVIDMRSGLDDSLSLRTFLHELAHCVLHVRTMPRVNVASLMENSIKEPIKATEKYMREEDEANALMKKWLTWARAYIDIFPKRFSEFNDEEALMMALLNYYK